MKKKLIAAAVMATLAVSTASVFAAAPAFSGDAKIEWNNQTSGGTDNYLINRVRLNMDASIDDTFSLHSRAVMLNDLKNGNGSNRVTFDQAYLGAKFSNVDIKAGKQSLYSGQGLLMDDDNFSGVQAGTTLENVKLSGFYGHDNDANKITLAEMATSFGKVNVGANYLKQDDAKYWGVNASTPITNNAAFNIEYVKNTDTSATGYLAEVKVGNAVKKGDIDYSLIYRDIDAGAINNHTTNYNYSDSKGFKVKADYKVSDNAKLAVYHDMGKNHTTDVDQNRTNVEFSVNF